MGVIHLGPEPSKLPAALRNVEGLLTTRIGEPVKTAVPGREVRRLTHDGQGLYIKRIEGPGRHEIRREALILNHLRPLGFPVPVVLAWAEDGAQAALATAELPSEGSLEDLLVRGTPAREVLSRLAVSVAQLLGRLHRAGVNHRDFYLGHLLLGPNGTPHMVDFGRAERRRRVPWRRQVKDLAALHFSTPPRVVGTFWRLRFLARYLTTVGQDPTPKELRRWARRVAAKGARMERHALRKIARGDPNIHVNR